MSIVLLPNTAWAAAAQTNITDESDHTYVTEAAEFGSLAGGPRSLSYVSSDTDSRRFVYVNKTTPFDCTHIVLSGANHYTAVGLNLKSWTDYAATSVTEYSTAHFAETLVGKFGQDWVYPLPLVGKQAVGLTLTTFGMSKLVTKFFVSNGITLPNSQSAVTKHLPHLSRYTYRRQTYLIDEEWNFQFVGLTRAQVKSFEQIVNLLSEPLFLYDTLGTQISYQLLHGIITDHKVTNVADNNHTLTLTFDALRQWT